jgi:hypothetical protein
VKGKNKCKMPNAKAIENRAEDEEPSDGRRKTLGVLKEA